MVTQATLPGQHQMTEGDLQMGLEILDLVQVEPQCLLTAMEEDTSQRETVAMMSLVVKALQYDYVELKGNLHLLQYQALAGRPQKRMTHQPLPPSDHPSTTAMGPPTLAKTEGRLVQLRTPSPVWGLGGTY